MATRFNIDAVFRAIDKFSSPVGKMQSRMDRLRKSMRQGVGVMNSMSGTLLRGLRNGAIAASVALTGLWLALNRLTEEADVLAKRAERLNFPIEDLQEWQFVAEQAGLSTEVFDKNVDRFARTIGEAKANTGTMVTVLKRLDPTLLRQLKSTTNVSDALELYLSAMGKVTDPTKRAALANVAFGRAGAGMINVALEGEEGIRALREEMRKNGLITAEQAHAAEVFNDTMNSLKRSFVGFLNAAVLPLLPQLTKLAEQARGWIVANREMISQKVLEFFKQLRDNLPEIIMWMKRVAIGIGIFFGLTAAANAAMAALTLYKLGAIALSGVLGALKFVAMGFALATGPVQLGILAIATAIGLLIAFWPQVKGFFAEFVDYLFKIVDKTAEFIALVAGTTHNTVNRGLRHDRPGRALQHAPGPAERAAGQVTETKNVNRTEIEISAAQGASAKVKHGKHPKVTSTGAFLFGYF